MNIRIAILIGLVSGALNAAPSESSHPFVAAQLRDDLSTFGLEQAQAIADSQRVALYGLCGMCVFKQKIGVLWIFETRIGYAGSKVADIRVMEPPKKLLKFDSKIHIANKAVDVTPTAVTPAANAPVAPSAGVPHH
jgi:hypothetical protein